MSGKFIERRGLNGYFQFDAAYVDEHLEVLAGNEDLSRYIL